MSSVFSSLLESTGLPIDMAKTAAVLIINFFLSKISINRSYCISVSCQSQNQIVLWISYWSSLDDLLVIIRQLLCIYCSLSHDNHNENSQECSFQGEHHLFGAFPTNRSFAQIYV
jgi:hypothetical protein